MGNLQLPKMAVSPVPIIFLAPVSYTHLRFLNDDVFDPLECLLLGKGKAWRQVILSLIHI